MGPSNWTPEIRAKFRARRGYDPLPWLPALTGVIVGSRARSDAFLYDFRRTLAELTADEHYATVARIARAQGLTVYGESLEGTRSFSSLGDDLDMRRFADVPMGTMWAFGKRPAPEFVGDMRGAASVAHLYGKPYVAAESLTSILNPWAYSPAQLRPMIDAEFVNGINRPFLHSVVHQPDPGKQPGLSLRGFGQFFNRHETWAEMARPWIDYIARTSFLLQRGRNVADLVYFYGEEAPLGVQAGSNLLGPLPKRYAYDFVSAEGLTGELSVEGGELVSKGGARYRALFLGGSSRKMTLPVLRKLAALAEGGATIIGRPPESSPSLADSPAEFARLTRRLWSGGAETRVGQGRVIAGSDIEAGLAAAGIAPDFSFTGAADDNEVEFAHRRLDGGDIYFVTNRKDRPERIDAHFRVAGRAPEIWRADTGTIEQASYRTEEGQTVVPLELGAADSLFVIFRKLAGAPSATVATPVWRQLTAIEGRWKVDFQPGRGAPPAISLDRLASLSEQTDPGVRYFSGVATYTTSFVLPASAVVGAPLMLDLGKVGDVAEVRVNGQSAGIAWKPPYRLDVGRLVRRGRNTLEVKVANLWANRLIGDQQPGAAKLTFTTIPTYTAKAPLRPSGLVGPVTLHVPR